MLREGICNMQAFKEPIYVTRPMLPPLEAVESRLKEIWGTKWLTNCGHQHQMLEEALLERLKVSYLSLFNNCTTALMVLCRALELSGEVITTPFTFAATPHVLAWNNIKPVFCDIDLDTMNIDADKIESMITPKTTGILAVHVFGTPCNVDKIQDIANNYGLRVIYDAAHAFNVEVDGRGIGTYGDASAVSFHATKLYHTLEGGAALLNSEALKKKIDYMKNFGIQDEEHVAMSGINGKMNEIQAAIGLINLEYVDKEIANRKMLTRIYREELDGVPGIRLPIIPQNVKQNYQYFVIRINEKQYGFSRNYVYEKLKEYNIYARKYFYPLCSDYACYRQLESANKENLANAVSVGAECLSLPLYGALVGDHVRKICAVLRDIRKGRAK